ncbi:D-amino acid dehydrogenase small subunit [Pseudomonas delhiensis]|uniref:D-amino acid dehydrogenase n=1 Tax=Pseudomonas delhiensis TaxID=366289 RepID=A0A239EC54_9PSED|nr:D-amino acid dehydrogenase [Pseudomonas delhiensis]SDI32421.1 D-amino acid dehydrogenase small subunit [Pseudomonas delhiensis]SNS41524.1 D-amino acid dehydrogenase small subunit [Pseudomonas delhiensis]
MAQKVCIIGAGVVGLATAYALVREGFEVTVLEARDQAGLETSYANGGQLSYRYVAPLADRSVPLQALGWLLRDDAPLRLRPRLDPQQWRWMLAFLGACRRSVNQRNAARLLRLALFSQATLTQWREDGLEGFDWRRNGKLVAFREASSFQGAQRNLSDPAMQFVLDARQCRELDPALAETPFVGGILTPDEEVADCHLFCLRLVERLLTYGSCRIRYASPVSRLLMQGNAVKGVEAGGETIEAEHVVLAAGYRSATLLPDGPRLPLYPLKGYSLTAPIGPEHQAPTISLTDYDRKVVFAGIGDRLRVAAMVDIVGFDPSLEPRRLALLRTQAQDTLPRAGNYAAASEWAGMRPATPTGMPLVGPGGPRNLWFNLGHGALGFTLACGSGRLIAERIARRTPSIDDAG